jgi:hypothetical protein
MNRDVHSWAGLIDQRLSLAGVQPDAVGQMWSLWDRAGKFGAWGQVAEAQELLDQAATLAEGHALDVKEAPVFSAEWYGLRSKLVQDDHQPLSAATWLAPALRRWLRVASEVSDLAPLSRGRDRSLLSAMSMVRFLYLTELSDELGAGPRDAQLSSVALRLWARNRLIPEVVDIASRTILLNSDCLTYEACQEVFGWVAETLRGVAIEGWRPEVAELALRRVLFRCACDHGEFAEATYELERRAGFVAQLGNGSAAAVQAARLGVDRAELLLMTGELDQAQDAFISARKSLHDLGRDMEEHTVAARILVLDHLRGRRVTNAMITASQRDLTQTLARQPRPGALRMDLEHQAAMREVEILTRWELCRLAQRGNRNLEDVLELLAAAHHPARRVYPTAEDDGAIVAALRNRTTLLVQRLRRMPGITLVTLEPGLQDGVPPVMLTVSSHGSEQALRWSLTALSAGTVAALKELGRVADIERRRCYLGEQPSSQPPSQALVDSAVTAWKALPEIAARALTEAALIIYMPSAVAGMDLIPFELLRHPGGWLGTTHSVVRSVSVIHVADMLSPNRATRSAAPRATIVEAGSVQKLDVLRQAADEIDLVDRALRNLGAVVELRPGVRTAKEAVECLAAGELVHWVGHGFADSVGEFLGLDEHPVGSSELRERSSCADFLFFSSCLVGRGRHIFGAGRRSLIDALIERGACTVVAALHELPDDVCPLVCEHFYRAAATHGAANAMRATRAALCDTLNPVLLVSYVVYGDPSGRAAGITATAWGNAVPHLRWPSFLTRWILEGRETDRIGLLESLDRDNTLRAIRGGAEMLRFLCSGGRARVRLTDLRRLATTLARSDLEGAGACAIAAAVEEYRRWTVSGEPSLASSELWAALDAAALLEDSFALLTVAWILAIHCDNDDVHNVLQGCIRHASSALPMVDQHIRSAAQAHYMKE